MVVSVDVMEANDAREELRLCYLAWGINTGFLEEVTLRGLWDLAIKTVAPMSTRCTGARLLEFHKPL